MVHNFFKESVIQRCVEINFFDVISSQGTLYSSPFLNVNCSYAKVKLTNIVPILVG